MAIVDLAATIVSEDVELADAFVRAITRLEDDLRFAPETFAPSDRQDMQRLLELRDELARRISPDAA